MIAGQLPRSLEVNDTRYPIRSDFREILQILVAYDDPELEDKEKVYVCLYILYPDFDEMPETDYEAAYKQACWFIQGGGDTEGESHRRPIKTVDWQQDERLLFAAVNRVAGKEIRAEDYLHWWTFLGYFSEITEGPYAEVLRLRVKKGTGKPLEKWEQTFWSENHDICKIRPRLTAEEKAIRDKINALLDS